MKFLSGSLLLFTLFLIACGDDSSTSAGNLNDDGISSKSSSNSAKSSVTATMQATAPGTAAFAFSALPAGFWGLNGDYDNKGNNAYFWSSTEDERIPNNFSE